MLEQKYKQLTDEQINEHLRKLEAQSFRIAAARPNRAKYHHYDSKRYSGKSLSLLRDELGKRINAQSHNLEYTA